VKALETELAIARDALTQAEAQTNADGHDFAGDLMKTNYGDLMDKGESK
jgi:hypothetical protein